MGAKTIKLQSATKLLRHCTQIGWLQGTKESIPLFPTLHSKLGCLLFPIGSSNSGTTLHGGDGGGKALHVFSRFEVSKGRFRQFDFFLQVQHCTRLAYFKTFNHPHAHNVHLQHPQ